MRNRAIVPNQAASSCPGPETARGERPRACVEFQVPGRAEMLALIRARVAEFARPMPFSTEAIQDLTLAVGEAGANAIRHGSASTGCEIGVRMERLPSCVKVVITDHGCGFDPATIRLPKPGSLEESGRGIMLMRALVDDVHFHFGNPGGTQVELTKFFAPPHHRVA